MLPGQTFIQKETKEYYKLILFHMLFAKLYCNIIIERFLHRMKNDIAGFVNIESKFISIKPFLNMRKFIIYRFRVALNFLNQNRYLCHPQKDRMLIEPYG